ncbi:MAG TPA: hypothetical protein VIH24_07080 [Candidatus Limnocylindria bacterium]|jgi:tetratricopeptide (TPR) repeat protein
MPEILLLAIGLAAAGAFVLSPLWRGTPAGTPLDERDAAQIRHRVALEALRDVEADHRAGSLDGEAYAAQLAEVEAHAAETRAALDVVVAVPPAPSGSRNGRTAAFVVAGAIGIALLAGTLVPASGLANATVVNRSLAAAQATEAARQARITELLTDVAADPTDAATLSDLADAYLAGSSGDDLARAAASLQLLINAEPGRADAYERLMTAYLRAGDYLNARAVHDSYAELDTVDPVEAAFFDGLIALRGEGDPERALAAFDEFLELAQDDPRAGMVQGLRDEADAAAGD